MQMDNNNAPLLPNLEDSPVFNYISNLSPINSIKSVCITQATFSSLNFSPPSSIFASPHLNSHKESTFLKRHNLLDTSKPKVSSVNNIYSREEAPADSTHAYHDSNELQENTNETISVQDASIDPSTVHTDFSFDLLQALKYNSGSPEYDPLPCADEANSLEAASDAAYVQEGYKQYSIEGEKHHLQSMYPIEPKIEGPGCGWDGLTTDASDMLIFSPPNLKEAFKGLMNEQLACSMMQFSNLMTQSTTNTCKMQIVNPVVSGVKHEFEDHPSEPIAVTDTGQTHDSLPNVALMASNPSENINDELVYVSHRIIRRRCLDFEMASVRRKNSDDNSNTSSSAAQFDGRYVGNEKQLLPTKHSGDSQRRVLPGIGLHLNALANIKDYQSIKNENLSSGGQEYHLSAVPASSKRDLDSSENEVQHAEDCTQSSTYMAGEDFHHNSSKKKRRKYEPAGESESCKRCNCKKSKCLKLYCECFAAGFYCTDPCSCQDCFNKEIHKDAVLQSRKQIESRNPLAFAPKVIISADSIPETGDDPNKTPASARHKRGCNCKKSSCLKKYCECYQGGVGCSISCRCEGCKNTYGRKDGSAYSGIEETEACEEKGVVEKASQKTEIQNIEDHPNSALPTTPLPISSSMPLSLKGKPPRSFITTISAAEDFASQKLGKPGALLSQPKFEKPFQCVVDNETSRGDNSRITCIKTSPNGKRISSPNCHNGSSATRRGGRKLILQSIPSFPSLTPPHSNEDTKLDSPLQSRFTFFQ